MDDNASEMTQALPALGGSVHRARRFPPVLGDNCVDLYADTIETSRKIEVVIQGVQTATGRQHLERCHGTLDNGERCDNQTNVLPFCATCTIEYLQLGIEVQPPCGLGLMACDPSQPKEAIVFPKDAMIAAYNYHITPYQPQTPGYEIGVQPDGICLYYMETTEPLTQGLLDARYPGDAAAPYTISSSKGIYSDGLFRTSVTCLANTLPSQDCNATFVTMPILPGFPHTPVYMKATQNISNYQFIMVDYGTSASALCESAGSDTVIKWTPPRDPALFQKDRSLLL